MATGGLAKATFAVRAPDPRTRSVWLTQLVLAASVVIINLLVLILQPAVFVRWNYGVGVALVLVITLAALAIPWSRLPAIWVLAVPFADAIAIALMAATTDLRFGYLWVFPVMWVGMHFGVIALAALLATVGVALLVETVMDPGAESALRVIIVLLSLTFIGITSHLALRRTRSLRRLLGRQAKRLTVTAQRRSGQERRTAEILNGIDTGIARLGDDGRVLAVNDAYSRLYGLDPRDPLLPARSVEYTGMRGMPVPLAERPFTRAQRGETFTDASVWLFTPEGEWRTLSITAKRLGTDGEEGSGILLVVHDVTAITYAQRERERLTAVASHELKHPLTVMIGNAELALEVDDLTPRTRGRFEAILHASERMLEMTNSMLSASRKDLSGRDDFDDIDLRSIVLDSVASFRPTARANDVELEVDASEPLPVTADGFRLRQVIDNIVSNAIKYTPPAGRVRIVGHADGDTMTITVADTGIGIPSADLPHVMTPYFRSTQARETATGTGLGLGITREIVTAHGGTLTIESEEGAGTTVTVSLPRGAHTAPAERPV
ncbi:PAS domain-containing sensor histidine kinase [Microbacterium sp. CFH 90308]|uniref:histidine kinase n=1 Tax=Microbacterium salsuginis TaxID=2722803 RepID=A0ABX1KBE0_9MICO|nr:PAS domain-containing sensor histidine kinase [Microbacterium sp. CFH 90308]NLP84344.1 PAS domain-containing sensor histidine kinase [Microbacterium sp. CFH 90308]